MVNLWLIMVNNGYPLVNSHIANWKDPPFLMGKSTISMAIFNSYVSLPGRVAVTLPQTFRISMVFSSRPHVAMSLEKWFLGKSSRNGELL